jgi:putative flippase GtrA
MLQLIAFLGVFLGCLVRTVLPFLQKLKENPDTPFEWKYLVTFVIAIIESLIVGFLVFSAFPLNLTLSPLLSFLTAFSWAYTSNDVFNRIIASASTVEKTSTTVTAVHQ